jgi:hypothetical protein
LSLAFEYQGETHYFSSHIFGKASTRQQRDEVKRSFAKQLGITLISIPFWWDKSPNSLASTIQLHRPDVKMTGNLQFTSPIPSQMPPKLNRFKYTPNRPKQMGDSIDPTGW